MVSQQKYLKLYFIIREEKRQSYYFDEKGECDFVVMKNGALAELILVCSPLMAVYENPFPQFHFHRESLLILPSTKTLEYQKLENAFYLFGNR